MAAALAYYSTFSMAPLLIIVIWVAGLIFGADAARGEIFSQLEATLGTGAAEMLQGVVEAANEREESGAWASIIGIALLVVGATGVFLELQDSLNTIWKVKPDPNAGFLRTLRNRFLSFSLVVACGFLLLVSLVVSAGLSALEKFVASLNVPGGAALWQVVHVAVSLGVVTLLFAMVYKFLPDVKLRWRDMWVGAFITALLFTGGKYLIGLYLAHGSVASAYGAAGTLVVWLVWVYYSSVIVLFGAELTRVYASRKAARREETSFHEERIPVGAAG
jgi:membrane protein